MFAMLRNMPIRRKAVAVILPTTLVAMVVVRVTILGFDDGRPLRPQRGGLNGKEFNESRALGVSALLAKPCAQEKLVEALTCAFKGAPAAGSRGNSGPRSQSLSGTSA